MLEAVAGSYSTFSPLVDGKTLIARKRGKLALRRLVLQTTRRGTNGQAA